MTGTSSSTSFTPAAAARFLRALHLSPHRSFDRPGALDWSQAPPFLPQPLGATLIPLPPVSLPDVEPAGAFARLGRWLSLSMMCHRVRWSSDPSAGSRGRVEARRVLASGGAAYPTDLYLRFGSGWARLHDALPRHAWVYLPHRHALAAHCRARAAAGAECVEADLVTVLPRTAFKYGEFAYRLSAVDTGVALGRLIWLADLLDLRPSAAAPDPAAALALVEPEELVAAGLSIAFDAVESGSAAGLPRRAVRLRVEAGKAARRTAISAGQPAIFAAMRQARVRPGAPHARIAAATAAAEREEVGLPRPAAARIVGPAALIHRRRSEAARFVGLPTTAAVLAACLARVDEAQRRLGAMLADVPAFRIGCAVVAVQGLPRLAGTFDPQRRVLIVTARGAIGERLNEAMLLRAVDMRRCAFALHVLADREAWDGTRGAGGYRHAQLGVGAILDAAMRAAVEHALSAHAFLGFSAPAIARLYEEPGATGGMGVLPMAQLCVGHVPDPRSPESVVVG